MSNNNGDMSVTALPDAVLTAEASLPEAVRQPRSPILTPRIGLIGCGLVGEIHRDRLLSEGAQIVAVSDPDADALAHMAQSLPRRPRVFRSERDLVTAGLVDAVVICTPHGRHAEQVSRALDENLHVLCEKPFVTPSAEAARLVAQAREADRALFVAYSRRSRGHARFLQDAARRIGPLKNVIISRAQPWLATHRRTWRVRSEEGGGFLLDTGASMLDLLLHLIPESVMDIDATLETVPGVEVDVRDSVRLTFTGGARVELILIGDATEKVERIQMFGENGSAGWMLREDKPHDLYIRPVGGPSEDVDVHPFRAASPDAAFIQALRDGVGYGQDDVRNLYDAASAIAPVALVERIYREARWR